jgi:hypothetical protein
MPTPLDSRRRSPTPQIFARLAEEAPLTWREVLVIAGGLVATSTAVLGTHIAHGAFYTDDWAFAALYHENAGLQLIHAFATATPGRPALSLYLPTIFAVFGLNPHAQLAWAAVLVALLSLGVYLLLRELGIPTLHSLAVAVLLVVLPFADATKLWTTASVIEAALVLYVFGLWIAVCALASSRWRSFVLHGVSLGLFAASIMTYEVTVGLVLGSIFIYAVMTGLAFAALRWACDIAVAMVIVLTVTSSTVKTVHRGLGYDLHHAHIIFQQGTLLFANVLLPFGPSVGEGVVLVIVASIAACGVAVMFVYRRIDLAEPFVRARRSLLVAAGGLVFVIGGYLVYVPADLYYSPYGTQSLNRVNAGATMGFVILAVGLLMTVSTVLFRSWRWQSVVVVLGVSTLCFGYTRTLVRDEQMWDKAGRDEATVLEQLSRAVPPNLRSHVIYLWDSRTELTSQLPVFDSTWDLPNAAGLLWNMPPAHVFPVLSTTVFKCEANRMYPEGGLYGPGYAVPYGAAAFVAPTSSRAATVSTQSQCRSLVAQFSTPHLAHEAPPANASPGSAVTLYARATLGLEPLDAIGIRFQLGNGGHAPSCEAVTLPTGVAACTIVIPPAMHGPQTVTTGFSGTPALHPTTVSNTIVIQSS